MLDIYFRDPANKPLLEENYELVDVNIGHYDANPDIAENYGIPIKTRRSGTRGAVVERESSAGADETANLRKCEV